MSLTFSGGSAAPPCIIKQFTSFFIVVFLLIMVTFLSYVSNACHSFFKGWHAAYISILATPVAFSKARGSNTHHQTWMA